MSYQQERVNELRRHAMTLIHNADTLFGRDAEFYADGMVGVKTMMYARAAAYLALERNERASGELSVNSTVDQHFTKIGEEQE